MNICIEKGLALLPEGLSKDCSIYIEGDGIVGINSCPNGFKAKKTIDGSGKLIIPGLINSHTHAYMTVFRNYADDLSFHDWLFGKILPLEDLLTGEDCYWGSLLGIMEMLSTGTTCFLDMYIYPGSITQAVLDSGIRGIVSRGLTGGDNDREGGRRRLREAIEDMRQTEGKGNIGFMLAPHAPYSCDEGYQREIAALAKEHDLGIHIHVSESKRENEDIIKTYKCTPAQLLDRTGLLGEKTVAAHCVYLNEEDMEIFKERGVSIAANPVSNLKLANGIAKIPLIMEKGINVCIGTDGPASNNSLNMIREMGYNALLHKGVTGDPETVNAETTIKMATKNAAKALGIGDITGEISVGKKADLSIIDLNRPNMQPENNSLAALVYSANGSEVETVIVGGEILYQKGDFLTIDAERVIFEVESICKRIGMRY